MSERFWDSDPELRAEGSRLRQVAETEGTRHPPLSNGHNAAEFGGVRFQFTRFRDIRLDTAPPYLVHDMIPRVGVVIVWGKPKSGKTFWVFDLEMHIALGWPYRGRHVEGGEVLHIACEGVRGLGARKEAWRLHHTQGKSPDAVADIENAPFHLCKNTALDLINDAKTVIADIGVQFGDKPIKLITIDTLNRSLRGSESKDEDMGRYLSAAILLAEKFQCCVLIVHHCGYNEERPRGHSSLIGSADALIEIKKGEHDRVCTEVEEMRDGPNSEKTCSRLKVIEVARDDNGNPITSCVVLDDGTAIEQPPKKSGKKPPSPTAQKFYDVFANAAASFAEIRPESGGRPSITEDLWTQQLEKTRLLEPLPPADDKTAHRTASNRRSARLSKCRSELIATDWIRCNDKFVWSIREKASLR